MKTIGTVIADDVVCPSESLPEDAKMIVFNGTEYVIYEDGDELPSFE